MHFSTYTRGPRAGDAPCEQAFSTITADLRGVAARTQAGREAAITEAVALITPDDARGWFTHCGYPP